MDDLNKALEDKQKQMDEIKSQEIKAMFDY